jgi:hypothetical protein
MSGPTLAFKAPIAATDDEGFALTQDVKMI